MQKYLRSNQQTCINHRPIVWKGEKVKSGQILTDGPAITSSELSLGQNVLIGYMPWQGYNFEDAILISERLVLMIFLHQFILNVIKLKLIETLKLSERSNKKYSKLKFV